MTRLRSLRKPFISLDPGYDRNAAQRESDEKPVRPPKVKRGDSPIGKRCSFVPTICLRTISLSPSSGLSRYMNQLPSGEISAEPIDRQARMSWSAIGLDP